MKNRTLLVVLALSVCTLAAYWGLSQNDFVNYDDNVYITGNAYVTTGVNYDNIKWAFTTGYAANWHPLTWISHMIDVELFGLNPGAHHYVNLFFHILNTLLLFLVFKRMTREFWPSAFIAALFALHPFHVESVAWASERKDVLSGFFWLLTMWMYVRYTESPGFLRYVVVLIVFSLGLMAKPMLVTLPFALLLIDYWPLNRLTPANAGGKKGMRAQRASLRAYLPSALRLVGEKVPMVVLAAISSYVTFVVQQQIAMTFGAQFTLPMRIGNALLSYVSYFWKTIWPSGLSLLYVHRAVSENWQVVTIPTIQIVAASLFLIAITTLAILTRKRYPYFLMGWLWFVGTLIPVIGLVQVGEQAMADRYTYIPHIGLFAGMVWGLAELVRRWHISAKATAGIAGAILIGLAFVTWQQVGYWKDSISLFKRTIGVNTINPVAHYNLGYALADRGQLPEAVAQYNEALAIVPTYAEAHSMLSSALLALGRKDELAEAKWKYGSALGKLGRLNEAIGYLTEAVQYNPSLVDAQNDLGTALAVQGKIAEASEHFAQAVYLNPNHMNARYNFGLTLEREGKFQEAAVHYRAALRINPEYADAKTALARVEQLLKK